MIEKIIRNTLERWGYWEIKVPILGEIFLWKDNNVVKILDGKGDILALRPEITSLVIQNMNYTDVPVRVYYMGPIFLLENDEIVENFQIGWELISVQEEWRDIEGLMLIIDILSKLNIEEFVIEINTTEIWEYIWRDFEKEKVEKWKKYLVKKDYVSLIDDIYIEKKDIIEDIKNLIFYSKKNIKNSELKLIIEKLYNFKENLEKIGIDKNKIKISPRLFRPFDYYKGLIFQVYLKELKTSLGGGGSYIQYNKKGEKVCGIGFAFIEEKLLPILKDFKEDKKIFIGKKEKYVDYYKILKEEREKGSRVIFIPFIENLKVEELKGEIEFLK
ncbi:MAG: ATP phosphoribosyltransferase regulatory subunit [Dictyoglomaceae bacterium]|nr:ATP phosphoribosyltransferase regulatory subunit [Dictyoglomaceae bacterium]